MERLMRDYNKEYMKTTILKHEETFRRQVHELHRLYRVQTLLMRDMKNNQLKKQRILQCFQSTPADQDNFTRAYLASDKPRRPRRALNLDLPADEYIERAEQDGQYETEQEDVDIELKLTSGGNWVRKEDTTFTSNSGLSLLSSSSSSTESGGLKWGRQPAEDVEFGYRNDVKSQYEFDEGMREDKLRQAPWLMQCLSLKMA